MDDVIDEVKTSEKLNVAVQTLRNWRHQRKGPPYVKIGRSVRYLCTDIQAYLDKHRVDPEKTA